MVSGFAILQGGHRKTVALNYQRRGRVLVLVKVLGGSGAVHDDNNDNDDDNDDTSKLTLTIKL